MNTFGVAVDFVDAIRENNAVARVVRILIMVRLVLLWLNFVSVKFYC